MSDLCLSCSEPVSGRFCSHCGTVVGAAECAECGNPLPAGARFCNQCGATVAAAHSAEPSRKGRSPVLAWSVAGVAVGVAVLAVATALVLPRMRGGDEPTYTFAPEDRAAATPTPPVAAPAGDARAVDLASMSPREAADRLFDRIMRTAAQGDSAGARVFLPMALAAYQRVEPLDADARYHLAVLHLFSGDAAAARAEADATLAATPNHLFALVTAAQAERARGDKAAARSLYDRFLKSYDTELAANRPEYQAHQPALPGMRAEAEAFLDR